MEGFKKVSQIDNQIEAQVLESILTDRNIPHRMESYYDTAYDGLFQFQKGWGVIWAPESHREEILEILGDLRRAPENPTENRTENPPEHPADNPVDNPPENPKIR